MRTSSIVSYTALLASSTSLALSFASPDSFDNSLLRARSFLPDVMPAGNLVKRAEGPWDCGDDEEYVAYDDGEDDDDEEDDTPVFQPNKGEVKAVAPPPATTQPAATQPAKQEAPASKDTQSSSSSSSNNNANNNNKAVAAPTPVAVAKSGSVSTPDNVAEGTYTAEEGCARFYTVKSGDICLGLVDQNSDLGLTLDQLYCLNPAIDDLCFNLWIGTSYCVGYNGEEPLNTGVSSKRA